MASVGIRDVTKAFGATQVIHGVDIDHRRRRVRRAGRAVGLRQVHAAAHDRGPGEHHRRRDPHRRSRRQQRAAERARHRDGVPELRALSAHDGRRQHGLLAQAARRAEDRDRQPREPRRRHPRAASRCSSAIPRQLSGGQRQRVAMGRAIVRDPQVFLFDEPLSNLDAKLRVAMRTEIKELHQRLKTTTVYVTHDQIEAMTMADKIVVMHDGIVEQIGAPLELYDRPDNLFVAGFIGSPAMNFLKGKVARQRRGRLRRAERRAAAARRRAGRLRRPAGGLRHPARAFHASRTTAPRPRSWWSSRPARRRRSFAKLGGEEIVAVFRERHKFEPGDKVRLKPDPAARPSVRRGHGQAAERLERIVRRRPRRNDNDTTLLAALCFRAAPRSPPPARSPVRPDRLGQGLGASGAVEAREGRQDQPDALEPLRARPRTRPSTKMVAAFKAATGVDVRRDQRIVRGHPAEGLRRGEHRLRAWTSCWGLYTLPQLFPTKCMELTDVAELSRQEVRRLDAGGGGERQARQQVARHSGRDHRRLSNYRKSAVEKAGFKEFPKDTAAFLELVQGAEEEQHAGRLRARPRLGRRQRLAALGAVGPWRQHGRQERQGHHQLARDREGARIRQGAVRELHSRRASWNDSSNNKTFWPASCT